MRRTRLVSMIVLFAAWCCATPLWASDVRVLVNLGFSSTKTPHTQAETLLADALSAAIYGAAGPRGYRLTTLERIPGLANEAMACRSMPCRAAVMRRVSARYGIVGHLERLDAAYRLSLWLEDAEAKEQVVVRRLIGDLPTLAGEVLPTVDDLLEVVSPEKAFAQAKLRERADRLWAKERWEDARRLYDDAIAISPFSPEAASLSMEMIVRCDARDEASCLWARIDEHIEMYGPRSAYQMAGIGDEAATKRHRRRLLEILSRRGTTAHREAQAATDRHVKRAKYEQAAACYHRYLYDMGFLDDTHGWTSTDEEADEMAFYLGEVRYAQGAYREAADAYRWVTAHPEGAYAKDAAKNRVFALTEALPQVEEAASQGATPSQSPPLAPIAAAYIEAVEVFASLCAGEADVPAFLYRAANLQLSHGQSASAVETLRRVIEIAPASHAGRAASARLAASVKTTPSSPASP